MKKLKRKYAAFDIGDGFILEIIGDDNRIDYYISQEDYGVKSMLFGVCGPFAECERELKYNMVNTDYSQEKESYRQRYMDE